MTVVKTNEPFIHYYINTLCVTYVFKPANADTEHFKTKFEKRRLCNFVYIFLCMFMYNFRTDDPILIINFSLKKLVLMLVQYKFYQVKKMACLFVCLSVFVTYFDFPGSNFCKNWPVITKLNCTALLIKSSYHLQFYFILFIYQLTRPAFPGLM